MTQNDQDDEVVLAAVNAAGTALKPAELAPRTGLPYERCRRALSRLFKRKLILRVESGSMRTTRWKAVLGTAGADA